MADPALDAPRALDASRADEEAEAKAAFHLRMRARGIQDRRVLRAFELVPRQAFVPHRYLDLAARDLALPIGCGQTLNEPWLVARMIEALAVERTHRVLEVGVGTGYATAILANLAETVIALERYQSLAIAAQARLAALGIDNAAIVWGDGLAVPASVETFDRIIAHGLVQGPLEALAHHLAPDGILVCARSADDGTQHVAQIRRTSDEALTETAVHPCHLQAIVPGLASTL